MSQDPHGVSRNLGGTSRPKHGGHHVREIHTPPTRAQSLRQHGALPLKILVAFLSAVIITASGVGYAFVGRVGGDLASVSDLDLGSSAKNKGKKEAGYTDGALDILLVGSDSRTDAQGNSLSDAELAALHAGVDDGEENTDTIMIIRIPEDGSRATAISIPRDTYVHDPGEGNMKINGVYSTHLVRTKEALVKANNDAQAKGQALPYTQKDIQQKAVAAGRAALLAQVKSLTGIEIDHYAEVGLLGFVLLTDAVGGVNVCLNAPVNDPMSGANFPAGQLTLNGAQGLSYVRQRYGLPRGDLDRIVRQQSFAASLVNKFLSSGTLTNPAKLAKISKAVERSVVLDEHWDVMSLVSQLSGLSGGNVTFTTIPVTSIAGVGDYGESIVTVDVNQVHQFFTNLAKSEKTEKESSATPTGSAAAATSAATSTLKPVDPALELHVLNAGSQTGLAGGIGEWLQGVGYRVHRTANAQPGIYTRSQIVAANPADPRALALAQQLGGLPITADAKLDAQTIVVVATTDYHGPTSTNATSHGTGTALAPAAATGTRAGNHAGVPAAAPVGTPGEDFGNAEVAPKIDAGGAGPRCVN